MTTTRYTRTRYKECSPTNTINQIQSICKHLGIELKYTAYNNTGNDYSGRLSIVNKGVELFNIGTNGKGMTPEYAMASAYAEFMERLQNKALFRENIKYATRYFIQNNQEESWNTFLLEKDCVMNFLFYPNECMKQISKYELLNTIIPKFFPQYNKQRALNAENFESIFAPLRNISTHSIEMFPIGYYRAICGTTGLCAGNSREEAIIQGINEICERYVLQQLFIQEPDLPTIELACFEDNAIYHKLSSIGTEYDIHIKDCSLGMGLPVLGLLLIDKNTKQYSFRLGADYSIVTALERCFTETFQGKDANKMVFNDFDITKETDLKQYFMCKRNGTGIYPHCVLRQSSTPSRFPALDFISYTDELDYYIDTLKQIGFEVYVKDNSFTGFYAYAVYIPGLSEINESFIDFDAILHQKNIEFRKKNPLLDIQTAISDEADSILPVCSDKLYTHFQKWNVSPKAKMYTDLLKIMINNQQGDYDKALASVESFIRRLTASNTPIPVSCKCLYDVLYHKVYQTDNLDVIKTVYSDKLVHEILEQVESAHSLWSKIQTPTCFNCNACPVSNDCRFDSILKLELKLQQEQVKYHGYANS